MGHYNFRKDLEESKVAEVVIKKFLEGKHEKPVLPLPRERQGDGDLDLGDFTVEVKFDKMAASTGNLCFEMANGSGKLTGIAATKAKYVYYVVPQSSGYTIYEFEVDGLRAFLFDKSNAGKLRVVNGGDRRAYSLMLLSIENVRNTGIAKIYEWVEQNA